MEEEVINIDDFKPGFKYQMKRGFSDGSVKTQQQYNDSEWIDCEFKDGDMPYINRIFNGKNAKNGLLGLRYINADFLDFAVTKLDNIGTSTHVVSFNHDN